MPVSTGTVRIDSARSIGGVVRFHRRRSGLSQHALADLAGVGKTSVFEVEKGKATVRLATLAAILRTLNVDLLLAGPLMAECRAYLQDRRPKPDAERDR